jgi:hypothetical protein
MRHARDYRGFTMLSGSIDDVLVYDRSKHFMKRFSSLELATVAIDRMLLEEGP